MRLPRYPARIARESLRAGLAETYQHMKTTVSQYAEALYGLSRGKSAANQSRIAADFVSLMRRKSESKKLGRIVKKVEQLQDEQAGIARVSVTTAFPVTDKLTKALKVFAKKTFESNDVILDIQTDKRLLGGVVMKTDNQMIDVSVAGRMKNIKKTLLV